MNGRFVDHATIATYHIETSIEALCRHMKTSKANSTSEGYRMLKAYPRHYNVAREITTLLDSARMPRGGA